MAAERHDALILGRSRWSETSLVLRLFTREAGRVAALAKGCRRKSSPMRGHFDLFAHEEVMILEPARGTGLSLATEAWMAEEFVALRRRPLALAGACWIAEGVLAGAMPGDPHPALFDRLLAAFRAFADGDAVDTPARTAAGLVAMLAEFGFAPRWEDGTPADRPAREVLARWTEAGCPERWRAPQGWRPLLRAVARRVEASLERKMKSAAVFDALWRRTERSVKGNGT
jgi:recombinational DNA repair protein (RecF pathway)